MFVIKFVRTVVMVNIIKLLLQKTANMSIFFAKQFIHFQNFGIQKLHEKI